MRRCSRCPAGQSPPTMTPREQQEAVDKTRHSTTARLLLSAADRPGLVAAIAAFIYRNGGDITQADQHNDEQEGMFFQRVEFRLEGFKLSREGLATALSDVAT